MTGKYKNFNSLKNGHGGTIVFTNNKKCKIISKDGFQMGVARPSFTKQFDFLAEKYPTKSDNPDLDVLGYDIVFERTLL